MAQSGGLCELSGMAAPCGASRQTLVNYLKVLEETGAVHVVRPFAKNPQREIIAMPKVYGFDTGFVCYAKGWWEMRPVAIECMWKLQNPSKCNFASFSSLYPDSRLVVIASDAEKPRVNRARGYVETGLTELEPAVTLAMEEL